MGAPLQRSRLAKLLHLVGQAGRRDASSVDRVGRDVDVVHAGGLAVLLLDLALAQLLLLLLQVVLLVVVVVLPSVRRRV